MRLAMHSIECHGGTFHCLNRNLCTVCNSAYTIAVQDSDQPSPPMLCFQVMPVQTSEDHIVVRTTWKTAHSGTSHGYLLMNVINQNRLLRYGTNFNKMIQQHAVCHAALFPATHLQPDKRKVPASRSSCVSISPSQTIVTQQYCTLQSILKAWPRL